ncbi:MAG: M15 family metallopeptidase [Hydrotalea sp.]|nr:M15 family metallopeptidase [Hydrotalea sp.]
MQFAMHPDVLTLRQKPIPDLTPARARRVGYRDQAIDKSSPHFNEPLVDAVAAGLLGKNYYHRADNPPYYRSVPGSIKNLYSRQSVVEKLLAVDKKLAGWGLKIFLHDGFRPRAVQAYFHDVWMPAEVRRRHPQFDEADVKRETEAYWAAPTSGDMSPAPHETGAAVDMTLMVAATGAELYMGSIFDDLSSLAHPDYFERRLPGGEGKTALFESFSDEEALANRRLIYWLMADAGFASHPNEWWHFSWGDQMWARLHAVPAAHYGLAAMPR